MSRFPCLKGDGDLAPIKVTGSSTSNGGITVIGRGSQNSEAECRATRYWFGSAVSLAGRWCGWIHRVGLCVL